MKTQGASDAMQMAHYKLTIVILLLLLFYHFQSTNDIQQLFIWQCTLQMDRACILRQKMHVQEHCHHHQQR